MHEGSVTVVILVLLVLIGIVSYYIYDYYGYKTKVSTDIKDTNQKVDTEKSERLGNVKSIVNQVNVVHDSIQDEFNRVDGDVNVINQGIDQTNKGIDRMMGFNDVVGGTAKTIGLKDLPSSTNPDVSLLTHVTSIGGLTIKNLDSAIGSDLNMKICAKEDPTKCIKIPDENGNVYLTNLYKDKAIALDGSTIINAPLSFTEAGKLGARISGNEDGTGFMETNAFGIGSMKSKPNASLHIMSEPNSKVSPFKISVNGGDVLDVDQNGTLHTTRIELRPAGTTQTTAILQAVGDGVMLDTANVYTSGDLRVNGVIYQSKEGATKTASLLTALAPAPAPTSTPTPSSTTSPTSSSTTSSTTISTFVGGPINMHSSGSYTMKPADYMNSPYLITVQ